MKPCVVCGVEKPGAEFYVRSDGRTNNRCKPCARRYSLDHQRKRRIADPEGVYWADRANQLRLKFGLKLEQFNEMSEAQGGACAICRKSETRRERNGRPKHLCVDHDHATGAVRALLCYRCNSALGMVGDDPIVLIAAAEYLKQHAAQFGPIVSEVR